MIRQVSQSIAFWFQRYPLALFVFRQLAGQHMRFQRLSILQASPPFARLVGSLMHTFFFHNQYELYLLMQNYSGGWLNLNHLNKKFVISMLSPPSNSFASCSRRKFPNVPNATTSHITNHQYQTPEKKIESRGALTDNQD